MWLNGKREVRYPSVVDFIDVTPALIHETQQGRMTYNLIWDTHLNAHGAAVVAQALADALRDHLVP